MAHKRLPHKELAKAYEEDLCLEDVAYLRWLAEALMHIPVTYGTDQGDTDLLSHIARKLQKQVENERLRTYERNS